MAVMYAADPASKVASVFQTVESMHNALKAQYIPIRPDGSQYVVQ